MYSTTNNSIFIRHEREANWVRLADREALAKMVFNTESLAVKHINITHLAHIKIVYITVKMARPSDSIIMVRTHQ